MNKKTAFKFRLYIAGDTQNSVRAVANLRTICKVHLPDRHEIEIVDVFREPKRALAEGIFMTPTLVRHSPSPVKKILGTLSQAETVLQALETEPVMDVVAATPASERRTLKSAGAALKHEHVPSKPARGTSRHMMPDPVERYGLSEVGINFITYATRNGTHGFCEKYGYQYLHRVINEFREDPKYTILTGPLTVLLELFTSREAEGHMVAPRVEEAFNSVDESLRRIGDTHPLVIL